MRALSLLFVASVAAACSSATPDDAASSAEEATSTWYGLPKGIDTTRAYFHRYTTAQPDPDTWVVFDLVANARVGVELQSPASKAGRAGGVFGDIYRVNKGGKLAFVASIDGSSGDGTGTFTSKHGGSYVIDVYESGAGYPVQVDLTCKRKDGNCSRKPQPGDACGACDDGLLCLPMASKGGACPAAGAPGTCGFLSDVGCGGLAVCGCDGKDYADACSAVAAGTAIKQRLPCSCDPTIWSPKADATNASVNGPYTTSWVVGVTRKDLGVTFDDVAGTYTETLTTGPDCSAKGAPCPAFPTQNFAASGTYAVAGGVVTLTPDAASSKTPPTSFTLETNCAAAVVLRAHEDGATEDFDVPDVD